MMPFLNPVTHKPEDLVSAPRAQPAGAKGSSALRALRENETPGGP